MWHFDLFWSLGLRPDGNAKSSLNFTALYKSRHSDKDYNRIFKYIGAYCIYSLQKLTLPNSTVSKRHEIIGKKYRPKKKRQRIGESLILLQHHIPLICNRSFLPSTFARSSATSLYFRTQSCRLLKV